MIEKILQYLVVLCATILLGDWAFHLIFHGGSFLNALAGLFIAIVLSGTLFIYVIREILYYARKNR